MQTDKSAVVCLDNFSIFDAGRAQFILFDAGTDTSVDILAATDASALQAIEPHVKVATSLAYKRHDRKARTKPRAAFSRCLLAPSPALPYTYKLDIELRWLLGISVVEDPSVSAHLMKEDLRLLSRYFPSATIRSNVPWTPSDFYDAVHVPAIDLEVSPQIKHKLVDTTLYPFQQRLDRQSW